MVAFLMTLGRIIRAVVRGLKEPEFQVLFFLTCMTLLSGTVFYATVEGLRILDALYFSVITLSTVGYGDFTPQTDFGKIFTILYIFTGIGLIMGFATKIFHYIQLEREEKKKTDAGKKP
ncbi:potassium channel family protein [Alkalicoccus halolimnae]|uniref:Potassium channel family protein n=1 Tax=Alkalicoccus halolimnae TaxID=1667239 RepID=A0A5C7FE49_9BACI|nr:potassium channel family protein [Alkalicoccus halolimnae]TXF81687.1 two pore domain potassium channel family protein [Alkalicoccus halolimnae]